MGGKRDREHYRHKTITWKGYGGKIQKGLHLPELFFITFKDYINKVAVEVNKILT